MIKRKPTAKDSADSKKEATSSLTADDQAMLDKLKSFSQRYRSADWKSGRKRR